MSDLSKCTFKECPLAKQCFRISAPIDNKYQSFCDFGFYFNHNNNTCEYFYAAIDKGVPPNGKDNNGKGNTMCA